MNVPEHWHTIHIPPNATPTATTLKGTLPHQIAACIDLTNGLIDCAGLDQLWPDEADRLQQALADLGGALADVAVEVEWALEPSAVEWRAGT